MRIEVIPLQTLMFSQNSSTYHATQSWEWPSEDAFEVEGYNYGTLEIGLEASIGAALSLPIKFSLLESKDKSYFQEISTSILQNPTPIAGGVMSVKVTRRILNFGKYIKPVLSCTGDLEPTRIVIRAILNLQTL